MIVKRPTPPCKDCKDRHNLCHGDCDKYKQFRSDLDKFNYVDRKGKNYPTFDPRGGNQIINGRSI